MTGIALNASGIDVDIYERAKPWAIGHSFLNQILSIL